ncbi:MAG: sulfite exporter TauE/SafE family protein [Coprobacillaceae bacterium]
MSLVIFIMLPAIVAGIVHGVTGFGAGIIIMMFLPNLLPVTQSAGVSTIICMLLVLSMVIKYRKHVNFKLILPPFCLYIITVSITILLSESINPTILKLILGLFLIALSFYFLLISTDEKPQLNRLTSFLCVFISSICDGLFGIGGPLMVMYYLAKTDDRNEYLGNIQGFFMLNMFYSTALRISQGIISTNHIQYILVGTVSILVGLIIANKIIDHINPITLKKSTYFLIGFSGLINILTAI